jgi:hypothetical protein
MNGTLFDLLADRGDTALSAGPLFTLRQEPLMSRSHWITCFTLIAAVTFLGCRSEQQTSQSNGSGATSSGTATAVVAGLNLPSGTQIEVTLGTSLSSESASVGDAWTGVVANPVNLRGRVVAPAGSVAGGTVSGVRPALKGDRAMLDLALTSFTVGNRNYRVNGTTEAIVAGSTRARNLGVIGAATAVGAVVGHAIGGSGKGTLIGAIVGGGAATGAVSRTKGWQVVLKQGTPLTFTTSEAVAVRP